MKHSITEVDFIFNPENGARKILVTFKDGKQVTITPLTTVGQKTFAQNGADVSYQWDSLPIAKASIKWLHGSDYIPNVHRFINKH